jgi:hypothetical protein
VLLVVFSELTMVAANANRKANDVNSSEIRPCRLFNIVFTSRYAYNSARLEER